MGFGRRLASPDASLESRLVWVFGSPRSGSTWLLQLLVHPLAPNDGSDLGFERRDAPDAGHPRAIPINEPYIPQHLNPPLPDEQLSKRALPADTLYALRGASPTYFLSDRYADVWRPVLKQLVLARLGAQAKQIGQQCSISNPLVIVKEPNGSIGADFVMSLFRRSRLLFLLRDGRDVVDSMVDAQSPGGWLADPSGTGSDQTREMRLDLVRRESILWLARTQAVQRAYDAHPPELRFIVRYEQARGDPVAVLATLDSWLGLRRAKKERVSAVRWNDFDSYPAEAKGRGMPLRAARPGLWQENLSEAEQAVMDEVMGPKLAELGYRVSPPARPVSGKRSDPRRSIGGAPSANAT